MSEAPPVVEPSADEPRRPRSLAQLIAGRATDLLAVGLVLMVGLSSGRQIVAWWRTEPGPQPVVSGADELSDWDARTVEINFGDAGTSLTRRLVQGDRPAAEQELARLCQEVSARLEPMDEPANGVESAWLGQLESLPVAIESSEEADAVYVPPSPLPQAVAVRQVKSRSAAGSTHRITATGWAFPHGDQRWLLYVAPFATHATVVDSAPIPLPAGAQRILGWRDVDGTAVVAFEGEGTLPAWADFYRERTRLPSHNVTKDAVVLRGQQGSTHWDVQLESVGGRVSGVCWCTSHRKPPPSNVAVEAPTPAVTSKP